MRFAYIAFLATLLSAIFLTACSSDIDVSCEPDCTDLACGPDPVCGHSCGTCGDNATCEEGLCECEHQACNELCCAADEFCRNDRCLLPTDPCFDDTTCATQHRECISSQDEAICGNCLAGYQEVNGQCEADCAGRVCGPSPSGDVDCGTCPGTTEYCTNEGLCEDDCAERVCGASPREGFDCGTCSGATVYCTIEGLCEDDCAGRVCGLSPQAGFDCGTCPGSTDYCTSAGLCQDDCAGRDCGTSPNEGFDCGTCSGYPEYCTSTGICEDDCAGRDCGISPHASYNCGLCSVDGEICISGQCAVTEWQDPPAPDCMLWQEAFDYCESLSFGGHNDWSLPTISALRDLVRGCPNTETNGPCSLTEDCLSANCHDAPCLGCSQFEGPSDGCYWPIGMQGDCGAYYSSSPRTDYEGRMWTMDFMWAKAEDLQQNQYFLNVRCVRPSNL